MHIGEKEMEGDDLWRLSSMSSLRCWIPEKAEMSGPNSSCRTPDMVMFQKFSGGQRCEND